MQNFEFNNTRSLVVEAGGARRLGGRIASMGYRRALVVTDPGLIKSGMLTPALDDLKSQNVHVTLFSDVQAEAFTSKRLKNPISDCLAKEALRLLAGSLYVVCADGSNLKARENMLLGACMAGMAFANAPVAAVHALAYPVGARFHVPHGLSNALVLGPVARFNLPFAEALYAELAQVVMPDVGGGQQSRANAFVTYLSSLSERCALPTRLRDVGIKAEDINGLTEDAMKQTRLCESDVVLSPLPLYHSYALNLSVLSILAVGATEYLQEKFSTQETIRLLQTGRFTLMPGVPTMFHYLLEASKAADIHSFPAIRYFVSAGAILPAVLNKEFEARFKVPLLDGYGITETSTMVTMNWPGESRFMGSCGLPLPGLATRIVNLDGLDVPFGDEGELIVRGPNVMLG